MDNRKQEAKKVVNNLRHLYIKDHKTVKQKLHYMKDNYSYNRKDSKEKKLKILKNGILEQSQINNIINELFNS